MSLRSQAVRILGGRRTGALLRRLGTWAGVLTICHHRIGSPSGTRFDPALWSATAAELDAELRELSRSADLIGPDDLPAALAARRGRHVLLTFDDGYRDNHDVALDILRGHGARAVFFVATGFVDRPRVPWWDEISWIVRSAAGPVLAPPDGFDTPIPIADAAQRQSAVERLIARFKALPTERAAELLDQLAERAGTGRCAPERAADMWMTWEMVRALDAAGMAIGGHTVDHPVLARLDREGQRREIAGCAARLAAELPRPPTLFSYPVGLPDSYDADTRALVAEHGFAHAFSLHGGWARPGHGDPLDLPRTSADWHGDLARLRATTAIPARFARY